MSRCTAWLDSPRSKPSRQWKWPKNSENLRLSLPSNRTPTEQHYKKTWGVNYLPEIDLQHDEGGLRESVMLFKGARRAISCSAAIGVARQEKVKFYGNLLRILQKRVDNLICGDIQSVSWQS
jgi:hypothetical protein